MLHLQATQKGAIMTDIGILSKTPKFWLGLVAYFATVNNAYKSPFGSLKWSLNVAGIVPSVFTIVQPMLNLPLINESLKLEKKKDFVTVFSAHLFSATALPLLTAILWTHVANTSLLLASMACMSIGSVAEIVGHFRDGWVFSKGSYAESGFENFIFTAGMASAFGLLAASFYPTRFVYFTALLPVLITTPFMRDWKNVGVAKIASFFLSSTVLLVAMTLKFNSPWPMVYFAQAFNIVRNSGAIIETGVQPLHALTSVYGWFSYIVPFGLSCLYAGSKWSIAAPIALTSAAVSIVLSSWAEKRIVAKSVPI